LSSITEKKRLGFGDEGGKFAKVEGKGDNAQEEGEKMVILVFWGQNGRKEI